MNFLVQLRKTPPLMMGVGILVLTVIVVGWLWLSKSAQPALNRQPVLVEAELVKVGPISRRVNTNGVLTAAQSVGLFPEIEGRIDKIFFEQGQAVHKGSLLIQLDDSVMQARLQEANARVEQTRGEYNRAKRLYDKNFGSKAAVEKASADLQAAQAALKVAEVNVEQTRIRAPFDGVVGLKNISEGGTVSRNQELLTIVALNPLYVDFPVPDSFLRNLKVGDVVDVTVEGFDSLPIESKIVAIDAKADPATHSIQVRAELENLTEEMRPGQFARVTVELGKENNALLIPVLAVEKEGETYYAYIVVDRVAVYTEVTLGLRSGGMVQVLDGLKKGDVVVTAGQIKLVDGMPVRLVAEEEKAQAEAAQAEEIKQEKTWLARLFWG